MVKEVKVNNLGIEVPKGSAFRIDSSPMMPKMHMLGAVVAPRGYGKMVYSLNLIKKLGCVDRLIYVSPSAASNKKMLDELPMLKQEDMFSNINDVSIIDKIERIVEAERDEYEDYMDKMNRYKKLMGMLSSNRPMDTIPDGQLLEFWDGNKLQPPKHKWGGRIPVIMAYYDDIFGSELMNGRGAKKMAQQCIRHRHVGGLKEGGSVGLSILFNLQGYKSQQGSMSKGLRSNLTFLALGRTKSEQELLGIAEEFSNECSRDQFLAMYFQAISEPHAFFTIDLFKKDNHPSNYRRNLDTFLMPVEEDPQEAIMN